MKFDPGKYINNIYGRWTVLEYSGKLYKKNGTQFSRIFLCECECGTKKKVAISNLLSGMTKGCYGCPKRILKPKNPLYKTWSAMINRCDNPKNLGYRNYGGRGIKICSEWYNLETFCKDVGKRPANKSIDRINNDGNYEPNNIRWATSAEQAQNSRLTNKLTASNLAKRVTYTRERIRQLTNNGVLEPYIESIESNHIIYKESAVDFLMKKSKLREINMNKTGKSMVYIDRYSHKVLKIISAIENKPIGSLIDKLVLGRYKSKVGALVK